MKTDDKQNVNIALNRFPDVITKRRKRNPLLNELKVHYELFLFLLPAVLLIFIFHYIPIYGIQIAFKDFRPFLGIEGSAWVGLKHFTRFFRSFQFESLMKNTLGISIYSLVVGFPLPIIFALILNQLRSGLLRRGCQTITYMPHFISTVVIAGMILIFLSPRSGLYGHIARLLGQEPINPIGEKSLFKTIYVLSNVWQHTGWGAIIYLAALAGVDPNLYEAATVDGANKFQKIIHIDIPTLLPTAMILLILSLGNLLNIGFEKVFLLQNDLNIDSSEIIATYVYKVGLISAQYSFSAAVGLFNNIINLILLLSVNRLSRHLSEVSLW